MDSVNTKSTSLHDGRDRKIASFISEQDSDYTKHAANAYPLLVNFLHVLAQNKKDRACTKQWIEDEAKTLLHQLGENLP